MSVRDLARLGSVYAVYWPLARLLGQASRLPAESYYEPVVAVPLARHFWPFPIDGRDDWVLFAAWGVGVVVIVRGYRTLGAGWSSPEISPLPRLVMLVAAAMVAWMWSTYGYNFYFDQGHVIDRVLLLACAALSVWRPLFMLPLAALGLGLMGQMQHPLGGGSPSHFMLSFQVVMVGLSALVAMATGVDVRRWHVLTVVLSLVASGYIVSGVEKLQLGWPLTENVSNLLFATYANGWLGFLDASQVSAVGRVLTGLDPLLALGTLAVELGMIAVLWGRRTAITLLAAGAVFHLFVFALSGIFFWMWIAINITLAWQLRRLSREERDRLFSRQALYRSALVLPIAVVVFQPIGLSWVDAPVSYTFRFSARTENGQSYSLPPSLFAPYDYVFTLGRFEEYVDRPLLNVTWGASDVTTVEALSSARDSEEVRAVEARIGRRWFDPRQAAVSDEFLRQWLTTLRNNGRPRRWLSLLAAPPQLVTLTPADRYEGRDRVCDVEVRLVTSFFDGIIYQEIDADLVRVIELSAGGDCDR